MKIILCCFFTAFLILGNFQGIDGVPVDYEEDVAYDDVEDNEEPQGPVPEFTVTGKDFVVRVGDEVHLPCQVNQLGAYVILWKKDDGEVLAAGSVLVTRDQRISLVNGSINIASIKLNDTGRYICQLSSTPPKEIVHTIDVQYGPSAHPVPSNGRIEVHQGSPVTLQCQVKGNPVPVVTWTRHGKKKFASGALSEVGNSLTFSSATRHHSGTYECTADNGVEEPAFATLDLIVTYEPTVKVEKLFLKQEDESHNVELSCEVHGEPKPNVWWLHNGEYFRPLDEQHQGSKHVIMIESFKLEDFGNYTCVAENKFGKQEESVEVTGFAGSVFLLRNKSISNGVELEWLTESLKPVTQYRLLYSHAGGSEEKLDIPVHLSAEKYGNVYSHVHQLHNMRPGTTYELSIATKNAYGWSRPTKFTVATLREENGSSHDAIPATGTSKHTAEKVSSGSFHERSSLFLTMLLVFCLQLKF